MQLVFVQSAILNIKAVVYWEHNNKREDMHWNNHQYKVGDKVLVKHKKNSKHKL